MPLYVTNGKLQLGEPGQLAAQRACCCDEEGDDPEDCFCPDFCVFQIQILLPVQTQTFPSFPCAGDGGSYFSEQIFIPCPPEYTICQQVVNFSFAPFSSSNAGFGASYIGNLHPRAGVSARVSLFCIDDSIFLDVVRQVNAFWLPFSLGGSGDGGFIRGYQSATFNLTSECRAIGNKTCVAALINKRARYLTSVPVEISFDSTGTSLGPWQYNDIEMEGDQSLIEADVDPPFLFRITQRQSCRIVDCNCSTSVNGLKATFDEKEFTLGTPHTIEEGNTRWSHEVDIAGSYNFYKDTFLPENVDCGIGSFSVPVELITLSLYCATDSTADPPVPRWMVEATTVCAPTNVVDCGLVATGFAQRLFNGHIPCYEAEPECVGPPGGAYIPIGSPIDVVEADGSPFLNPELPDCGAANFPSFRIEQNCSA